MGIKTVSLFSGAGGLDVGFEREGFDIVYASELNRDSAASWCANRLESQDVMHCGDILDQIEEISCLRSVDVIIGGPPCQGFSIAGKMEKDDPRNKFIDVFLQVVSRVKPRAFLMENVKALAISDRWKSIRESALLKAKNMGYSIELDVYCASSFGVSENRERMFFVGYLSNPSNKNAFQSFGELLKSKKEVPATLREVLQGVGKFGTVKNPNTCTAKIKVAKKPIIRSSAFSGLLVNGAGRPVKLDDVSQTLTASMGGNNTPIVDEFALADPLLKNWFEELREMLICGQNASTIKIPEYIRRLTLDEAAAIQTFPRDYTFIGSRCSRYRQIGNAVPCRLAQHAACAMKEAFF